MGYSGVDEIVAWYQKKIGAYDKQQWETTVEQRILSGFTHVPKKTAKLKTELIDVDLVRGSAFTKTKPKHGILTVLRLAVFRLLLLPFYTGWWSKQTCFKFSILLLVLYVLQILNTCLYFIHIGSSDDTNERVSASEVLVPFVMMLALTVIHSLIISTSPERGSVAKSSQGQPSGRRVKRTKRRSAGYAELRRARSAGERVEETEPTEETKFSKQRLAATHLHNSSSEEGGDPVSSTRPRRVVVWDTTPVKTKATPTVHADPLVQPDCKLREQLAGVDRINVPVAEEHPGPGPEAEAPPTPPHQDDDGFESLNGNEGSSDNNEEELAAPQPSCDKSGNSAVPSSCSSTGKAAPLQHRACDTSGNSVSACCSTCDTKSGNARTPCRAAPSCQCPIGSPAHAPTRPNHCDKLGNSAAHAHCDIRLVPSCQDTPSSPPLSSCCDNRSSATPTHPHPHPPHLYLTQDTEHGSDILQITISEATPPRSSYSPLASPHCTERRYSAPPSCDLGADSEGSERRGDASPVVREKLLTRRRGSNQQLLTVSTSIKGTGGARSPLGGSSFNSDSEEGESHESFCPGLTEGTTSAGEWIGITTNSEECSYSDVSVSSGGERQMLGGNMETDHPFAWEFEHSPSCILSPSCAASDKVSCTMWEKKDVKKADLSVLDISSAIIGRAEQIPDNMDYFYTGMIMSTLLSLLPSLCRTCSVLFEDDALSTTSTSPYLSTPSTIVDLRVNSTLGLISTWSNILINAAFSSVLWERYVILIGLLERLILGGFLFFLLTVAERTFKQRFLYAKFFSHLTSFRRARKSELPHFRLNKVRNIKTWLSVRSYLRKRGPQRSVDVIVTATFIITLLLLTFLSFEILKDSFRLHSTINVEALVWCLMLGVFLLRFMTLGTKINHKYRNMSVLITEQINLYLQIEQKPNKKDELMLANAVLKLAADLLKELESPFKISGLSANPYLYTITKVCILSALSGVLSELLGFKLKLHKIKIK
uniref:Homeodomain transcription factor n=1 Tax=Cacopsylla melanoneura TaxID=428564 RepID=A0A8D8UIJ2_9HEMI